MTAPFTIPKRSLTWFITGCSSGFGLGLARLVQARGHRVIASSRNPGRTPELVAEIEQRGGKWVQLDVTDRNSAHLMRDLEAEGEIIDVLVNNAGDSPLGAFEQFNDEQLHVLMETHYLGPCRLINSLVPGMRKRRFGAIVNIISGASLDGIVSMGPYGAAKAALHLASKCLAKELELFNIRVLAVCPGGFNTNMLYAADVLKEPPLPEDYAGTLTEAFMNGVDTKAYAPPGDPDKAVLAMYDVIVGEGAGAGHEKERFLPLGPDILPMVQDVQDYYSSSLAAFKDVCVGVGSDSAE